MPGYNKVGLGSAMPVLGTWSSLNGLASPNKVKVPCSYTYVAGLPPLSWALIVRHLYRILYPFFATWRATHKKDTIAWPACHEVSYGIAPMRRWGCVAEATTQLAAAAWHAYATGHPAVPACDEPHPQCPHLQLCPSPPRVHAPV